MVRKRKAKEKEVDPPVWYDVNKQMIVQHTRYAIFAPAADATSVTL